MAFDEIVNQELDLWLSLVAKAEALSRQFEKASRFEQQLASDNKTIADCYTAIRPYLAKRGWYVGPSMPVRAVPTLARLVREGGNEYKIELYMAQHIRSEAEAIEQKSTFQWPRRASILRDAFDAHRNNRFSLSIPTLLAQADGMCLEILGVHFFTGKKGNVANGTKKFIESAGLGPIMSSYVEILAEPPGMRISTSDRDHLQESDQPHSPLNRHGIMHGTDLDYDTEANSLRVLSLIGLLTDVQKSKIKC